MYNLEAAKHGVTMSVGFILLNIDKEGTPSTQLGPKIGIEKSSLSRTLKQMEELGLIFRKADKHDRRISRIFITEFGMKYRKVSREAVLAFQEKVSARIPQEKMEIFLDVINDITDIAMELEPQTSNNGHHKAG